MDMITSVAARPIISSCRELVSPCWLAVDSRAARSSLVTDGTNTPLSEGEGKNKYTHCFVPRPSATWQVNRHDGRMHWGRFVGQERENCVACVLCSCYDKFNFTIIWVFCISYSHSLLPLLDSFHYLYIVHTNIILPLSPFPGFPSLVMSTGMMGSTCLGEGREELWEDVYFQVRWLKWMGWVFLQVMMIKSLNYWKKLLGSATIYKLHKFRFKNKVKMVNTKWFSGAVMCKVTSFL